MFFWVPDPEVIRMKKFLCLLLAGFLIGTTALAFARTTLLTGSILTLYVFVINIHGQSIARHSVFEQQTYLSDTVLYRQAAAA